MALLEWWYQLEESFHPYDAASSPFRVSTVDFRSGGLRFAPVVVTVAYVVAFRTGLRLMRGKKAMDLRGALAGWNVALAVFSFCGAARTLPALVYNATAFPFRRSLCHAAADDWGRGPSGLWVQLFILSKFAELLDTFFIVARKKRLLFLHWYHHLTVLLYCWHSYATEAPHALYFVAMNYAVHAVMYAYYALMALESKPDWFPPECVTSAQILQMVVGIFVQTAAFRADCGVDRSNLVAGALMYCSYLALFVKFALDRFFWPRAKRSEALGAAGGNAQPAASPGLSRRVRSAASLAT